MRDGLKSIAERILPFDKGDFSPSPLPELVNVLTDELLVMAKETVAAVAAAAQPKPSGKAQLRLLAWVVADARGARVAMEKPLAETVGKRLDRQADKVRDDLQAATAHATAARDHASAAAAADTSLEATLASKVAAIDSEERSALERPHHEVYVGFHELEGLLTSAEEVEVDETLAASPPPAAPSHGHTPSPPARDTPLLPPPSSNDGSAGELANKLYTELQETRWELKRADDMIDSLVGKNDELRASQRHLIGSQEQIDHVRTIWMLQRVLRRAHHHLKLTCAIARAEVTDEDDPCWALYTRAYQNAALAAHAVCNDTVDCAEECKDLSRESLDELCQRLDDPLRSFSE